jgi:hypothetical protein
MIKKIAKKVGKTFGGISTLNFYFKTHESSI